MVSKWAVGVELFRWELATADCFVSTAGIVFFFINRRRGMLCEGGGLQLWSWNLCGLRAWHNFLGVVLGERSRMSRELQVEERKKNQNGLQVVTTRIAGTADETVNQSWTPLMTFGVYFKHRH